MIVGRALLKEAFCGFRNLLKLARWTIQLAQFSSYYILQCLNLTSRLQSRYMLSQWDDGVRGEVSRSFNPHQHFGHPSSPTQLIHQQDGFHT